MGSLSAKKTEKKILTLGHLLASASSHARLHGVLGRKSIYETFLM
jgi:hypothetical protein